jgi:hypothetical protein
MAKIYMCTANLFLNFIKVLFLSTFASWMRTPNVLVLILVTGKKLVMALKCKGESYIHVNTKHIIHRHWFLYTLACCINVIGKGSNMTSIILLTDTYIHG